MSWWNFFDPSYPDLQFKILGYQYPPYRRVQQKHGRGEIVFLKEGLVARRLRYFEWDTSDSITVQKMKFSIMDFFSKFNQIRAAMKYDNLIVIGNLNIDILNNKNDNGNYFPDSCDCFSLKT